VGWGGAADEGGWVAVATAGTAVATAGAERAAVGEAAAAARVEAEVAKVATALHENTPASSRRYVI
jgi:hypothetical protein